MSNPKSENRIATGDGQGAKAPGGLVLTRAELAAALQVSVRTVDRMVTAEDIPVMELREDLVRFYLPDVLEALRSGQRKFGRSAVAGEEMGDRRSEMGDPEGDHQTHESRERDH